MQQIESSDRHRGTNCTGDRDIRILGENFKAVTQLLIRDEENTAVRGTIEEIKST